MIVSDIGCEVTINGSASGTYFTDCDNVAHLDDSLVNTGVGTIYLYRFNSTTATQFNPYIQCSSFKLPRYYGTQNSSYVELANITEVTYNPIGYYHHYKSWLDTGLIFSVFVLMLLSLLKK